MNLSRTLPIAVLGLLALGACSSGNVEGTAAIGDAPIEGDGPLADAQRDCTDGAELLSEYNAVEAEMIPSMYRNLLGEIAENEKQTATAYIGTLADEIAPFDEDTLTLNNGWQQSDDGDLLPTGLIAGLIQTCVLDALEAPTHVEEHMSTTRALDGTQEDGWDDYQARWTYHPDSGMNLTVWTGESTP